MKFHVFVACAALHLASPAAAGTLAFPSDAPVASMTFPDGWKTEETDTGIQVFSPDEEIYIYVDVADAQTGDAVVSDAVDFLGENGVTIDPASLSESQTTVNGMEMSNLAYLGKDESGPADIGLSFLPIKADTLLVITYWGTKGIHEKHGDALNAIINSVTPAG